MFSIRHERLWMWQRQIVTGFVGLVVVIALLLFFNSKPDTLLKQVIHSGELRVVTRNAATTYFQGRYGPTGLEYDLMSRFADHLGVKLKISVQDNLNEIIDRVESGSAQIAAAGLTITEQRRQELDFSVPYQTITEQLVYNASHHRPTGPADLIGSDIEVMANSSHVEQLKRLKDNFTELEWHENNEEGSAELLGKVANGEIDFTIADSNEVTLNRRYHPELRIGFDISGPQQLAWAFPKGEDSSLRDEANNFLNTLEVNGELDQIIKRHYAFARSYDYIGTARFLRQIEQRLPRYRETFEYTAMHNQLDWRLLAAVAYQESHWNPYAVSPTGVRGIMMLTRSTARDLGIERRTNADESIEGGARYLKQMLSRIPDYIPEPDRTWMALAAYNVGFGHLEDARMITELRGGDPHKWIDVKESLPLLRLRKWYKKTRYGYARGNEPVRYVETIHSYLDIMNWYLDQDAPKYAEDSILAYSSSAL